MQDDQQLEKIIRLVIDEIERAAESRRGGAKTGSPSLSSSNETGGDILCVSFEAEEGLEETGRQLGYLQNGGLRLGLVKGSSALPVTFGQIRWTERIEDIRPDGMEDILKRYRYLLILNLSRRGLAELAIGVTASIQSELVYQALGRRMEVIAVEDPLLPDRVSRTEDPVHLSAIQRAIDDQRPKLERLGVELIRSEEVFESLSDRVRRESGSNLGPYRGFVTLEEVEGYQGRQIRLVRGTRLTPLAEEWLRDHHIEIRFVEP